VSKSRSGIKNWQNAKQAFSSMEKNCIHPTANSFAVWLAYHNKSIEGLCNDIDSAISQGKAIDDYFCASLYHNYFIKLDINERIISAGDNFESEIHGVMQDIEAARIDTNEFKTKLTSAKKELNGQENANNVRAVVGKLTNATDTIISKSTALEERITQSRQEIASLRQELEMARSEAAKDSMTGVANRKTFEKFYASALENSNITKQPLSLIMTDIDHFKKVNDKWGHQTGDQVICYVAGVLEREAPKNSMVARLGGEEFVIVAPGIDDNAAFELSEKIRNQVERKKLIRRNSKEDLGKITISIGIAQFDGIETRTDLLERVDKALYKSKHTGRNCTNIAPIEVSNAA
jgi:diguanylate cyclase